MIDTNKIANIKPIAGQYNATNAITIKNTTFTIILLKKHNNFTGKNLRTTAVKTISITIIDPSTR